MTDTTLLKILNKLNWNVLTNREIDYLFDHYPELLEEEE